MATPLPIHVDPDDVAARVDALVRGEDGTRKVERGESPVPEDETVPRTSAGRRDVARRRVVAGDVAFGVDLQHSPVRARLDRPRGVDRRERSAVEQETMESRGGVEIGR